MAGFGEDQLGVFQKKHIDVAVEMGRLNNIAYAVRDFERVGPRILGVDWDKYGASTNMVGMQLHQGRRMIEPFVRSEIPRGEFTFDNAVKKIIDLNEIYNFDWIMVDSGHGEHQIETLKKYGIKYPQSGLAHKVVRVNFSERIAMFDPILRKMDKKDIKPFMVNNAVIAFERHGVALNPADRKMIKQFEEYHVKRVSANGRPIYGEQDEHIVDCVMLCIHGFNVKYSDMMKINFSTRMHGVNRKIEPEDKVVPSREVSGMARPELDVQRTLMIGVPMAKANAGYSSGGRSGFRGRNSMPTRPRF
jgi:replicative DNA helicase